VRAENDKQEHPESLMDQAIRGELGPEEQAALDRHLAGCAECATEWEGVQIFRAAMAPGSQDDALNHAAVEKALARLEDETLDQAAVEGALARLQEAGTVKPRETLGETLRRRLGLRGWLRPALGLAFVGAAAVVVMGLAPHPTERPAAPSVAQVASPRALLVLDDGSEVAPMDGTTAPEIAEQTPVRTTVRLRSGGAQFRIRHDSRRVFWVDAGAIQIADLGTVFRVEHQAGDKIHVAVSEGRVAVLYPATRWRVELGAGEDRVFSAVPEPRQTVELAQEAPRPPAPAAFAPIAHPQPRARSADDPAGLLQAADIARQSRHPQAAVAPLRRLVDRYPKDPRAPSAAFTLGWVLLTDLGRAREAAAAFAIAERIAPRGALAEDAAARVAEAWQKAGDPRRAARAARHYEGVYPGGRYTPLMRGLIGEN
jgi:ferric-dicitrate binding protein FerR (iron transport regulator)